MRLGKIEIGNYRKFNKSVINFNNNITFLAGGNNTGKTSIIELLKTVFKEPKCNLSVSDLPIEYAEKISNILYRLFERTKKYDTFEEKVRYLYSYVSSKKNVPMIYLNIEVTYEINDDISKFSDYLMNLDESNQSFYFRFEFKHELSKLYEIINGRFDSLLQEYDKIIENKDRNDIILKKKRFRYKLLNIYMESFEPAYYFTDETFETKIQLDRNKFRELFHFNNITANKRLSDEDINKKYSISKEIINLVSKDPDWKSKIEKLPEKIKELIEEQPIRSFIRERSLDKIKDTINEIRRTNGGKDEKIFLDLEVEEKDIKNLIDNITKARYEIGEMTLNENAQGLGYSNLIYIHFKLESFLKDKNYDNKKVNFFIIEEPEAHMHPQMQKVFIDYLEKYYQKENIQGLITTHSSEIISKTALRNIRVLRPDGFYTSKIHDMSEFVENISVKSKTDYELKKFYSLFFNLNLSELIFADKAILYEGDTERMYIQSLISNTDNSEEHMFHGLSSLYIAYIQVGGAYAYNYKHIIEFLNMKTLILTDIDYKKEKTNSSEILESTTTNSTIKKFYKDENGVENPKIKEIYHWKNKRRSNLINLQFQDEKDFNSRTLEEAMLATYLRKNIDEKIPREKLVELKSEEGLQIIIPQNTKQKINIREIVTKIAENKKKTDFMYSVITNQKGLKMLPNYIKEGLLWLQE